MDFIAVLALIITTIGVKAATPSLPLEVATLFITTGIAYLVTSLYSDGDGLKVLRQALVEPSKQPPAGTLAPPRTFYRAALKGALDWVDERLNPEAIKRGDPKTALSRAWGWRLYDKCLLVSLLYPLLFVIGQWTVSPQGIPGLIGGIEILAADATQTNRALIAVGLIFLATYFLNKSKILTILKNLSSFFYLIFVTIALLLASIISIILSNFFISAMPVFNLICFIAVSRRIYRFNGAYSVLLSIFIITVVSITPYDTSSILSLIFLIATMLFTLNSLKWLHKRHPETAYCIFVPLALAFYGILLTNIDLNANATSLTLFLGLLPLVNAQFDFLSITATRNLLRRGLASESPSGQFLWGLFDVVVGLILFFLLCLTAISLAHTVNLLSGNTVIDLNAVFTNPAAHMWLFITFLTTLLPTFLHFILALFSTVIALCWPEKLRNTCAAQLYEHHTNGKPAIVAMRAHIMIALTAGACTALCVFLTRLLWTGLDRLHLAGGFILRACHGWHDLLLSLT